MSLPPDITEPSVQSQPVQSYQNWSDGSTCWLLRGHRFPIKAPSAVPWTAQCSHRHWNVSDHQPISAPGSHLPPHHHRRGWVERMLQREESWILLLHLGGPWTPSSPRASWRVPQQLHLHSRRVIEPKVLLSERFSSFQRYTWLARLCISLIRSKKIMGYFFYWPFKGDLPTECLSEEPGITLRGEK